MAHQDKVGVVWGGFKAALDSTRHPQRAPQVRGGRRSRGPFERGRGGGGGGNRGPIGPGGGGGGKWGM
jgi:hypothetical protein